MESRIRAGPLGRKAAVELRMGDSVRETDGRTMYRFRRHDRRANAYYELVVDPTTGDIVHESAEPLSEHQDHGDARRHASD